MFKQLFRSVNYLIVISVVLWLSLIGCSVLVMNHSNGNTVTDYTIPKIRPSLEAGIEYLEDREGLQVGDNITVVDSTSKK